MLNDLLPSGSYFRFNPPLMESCAMDEIDPKKIQNIVTDTHAYIRLVPPPVSSTDILYLAIGLQLFCNNAINH